MPLSRDLLSLSLSTTQLLHWAVQNMYAIVLDKNKIHTWSKHGSFRLSHHCSGLDLDHLYRNALWKSQAFCDSLRSLYVGAYYVPVVNSISVLEPVFWTKEQTEAWLVWTLRRYNLLQCVDVSQFQGMNGIELTMLQELDFKKLAPACGELLWSILDIWRTGILSLRLARNDGVTSTLEAEIENNFFCSRH